MDFRTASVFKAQLAFARKRVLLALDPADRQDDDLIEMAAAAYLMGMVDGVKVGRGGRVEAEDKCLLTFPASSRPN